MPASRSWLLYLEPERWQLFEASSGTEPVAAGTCSIATVSDEALEIAKALQDASYQGEPVILALATSSCLTATIDVLSSQMLRKRQLMHYQLEEYLPWPAEEYASDYIGQRDRALMVAARHDRLAGLLRNLEASGILLPVVAPLTWLALEHHLATDDLPPAYHLFWQDSAYLDLFEVKDGRPVVWTRVPATTSDISREVRLRQLTRTVSHGFTRSLDAGLVQNLRQQMPLVTELAEVSQLEAAIKAADSLSRGLREPLINLRQGELATGKRFQALGKELGRLKRAAAVMIVCLCGTFLLQSAKYKHASELLQGELDQTYQSVFPDKHAPDQIGRALSDEYRRLRGTRAPTADLPAPLGADTVLERLLGALPERMRFRLPEIQIDQSRVFLSGEVRSNADADQIAATLREAGFGVEPPRTQRLADKGFSVRLNAMAQPPAKGQAK